MKRVIPKIIGISLLSPFRCFFSSELVAEGDTVLVLELALDGKDRLVTDLVACGGGKLLVNGDDDPVVDIDCEFVSGDNDKLVVEGKLSDELVADDDEILKLFS